MKWERKFDGGLYEGVREDGLLARIVKVGVGQKGWTVTGPHYSIKVDGRSVGVSKYLADAKRLGAVEVPHGWHTVIGLGKKMGESHAYCACGWSISGSAGGVGRAVSEHLDNGAVAYSDNQADVKKWCVRAALPFTGRTS